MDYSISEAAKRMHLSTATLRYYDKEGLIPSVKRTAGGARIFSDEDFRWLNLISCLKKAGMSLKDIRVYMDMVQRGQDTVEARLQLFEQQRGQIMEKIADLQKTMDVLNYKCWFYATALQTGSEEIPKNMPLESVPEHLQEIRQWLRGED